MFKLKTLDTSNDSKTQKASALELQNTETQKIKVKMNYYVDDNETGISYIWNFHA